MTRRNPDRPRWRFAPVWTFAANRSRSAARLAARLRTLEHDIAVANAGWAHEKAARADAEARERRASEALDFLVAGRFEGIAKRSEGPA